VPVALKAGLVNNPPDGDEGELYAEVARSKPAPQGICVANSAGKVLDWALMFDDDQSVLAFLDHVAKRFARFPDAKQPVAAERYMRFPSAPLDDIADTGRVLPVVDRHANGNCPAKPALPPGTIMVRVFGRALDAEGKPLAETRRQEHYVEDLFHIPVNMQEELAQAVAEAGKERCPVAEDLARLLISHAYLGQLDVNPVGAPGGKGAVKRCEFWATTTGAAGNGTSMIRLEGTSEAAGASRPGEGGDGRVWQHEVRLAWEGFIEIRNDHFTSLILVARGSEKLKWGNTAFQGIKSDTDVTRLPAGHPIDLACQVRYGIIGEPVAVEEATRAEVAGAEIPDEVRRQVIEVLGPPFMVFRDKVQVELKIAGDQKEKLTKRLPETVQEFMQFHQRLEGIPQSEREKELHSYRQKSHEKLARLLTEILTPEQLKRLRQLELRQEGPFALGRPDVTTELKLTDAQKQQFMAQVQEMQKKFEPLIKEAQATGNPNEIRPKAMKIRQDCAETIEQLLTDDQHRRWKELLGDAFDPVD
jgi:hypothetical protein